MSNRHPLILAVLAASLLAALATGCQSKPDAEVSDDAAAKINVEALRERYQRRNPNHRIGVVTAVLERANLAAVGDVALQDFGIGDVLVFVDASEEPFNTGRVVNATSTALHVQYDADRRTPRVGELAVRLAR